MDAKQALSVLASQLRPAAELAPVALTSMPVPERRLVAVIMMSGAIIAPVALLFMAYALAMYRHRTWQILRRETVRYDDQRGPVLLVAILLAVFLLSYILAMVWIF